MTAVNPPSPQPSEREEGARAAFEAWYVQHMKSEMEWSASSEEITLLREGSDYGERGYLNGCWFGWQAATATRDAEVVALREALEEIALAGMSGTGMESEEGMQAWHARQAWKFIGIAARAIAPPSPQKQNSGDGHE
jgi:hypothetical protein